MSKDEAATPRMLSKDEIGRRDELDADWTKAALVTRIIQLERELSTAREEAWIAAREEVAMWLDCYPCPVEDDELDNALSALAKEIRALPSPPKGK